MRRAIPLVLASCYAPTPPAGTPCSATRDCPAPLVCSHATDTCETTDVPSDATDHGIPGHVTVAPGWSARVLVDLSGALPYVSDDFSDGNGEVLDNAPRAVATLYPPFSAELAVAAGRSLLEIREGAAIAVHDFRPAMPDTTGPDQIAHLVFATTPDHDAALWATASSQRGGDGLYAVSPMWQLTRDLPNNNGNGVAFDAIGGFDGVASPTLYLIDQSGVLQRTGMMATTVTVFAHASSDLRGLVASAFGIYTVFEPAMASAVQLQRIEPVLHTADTIAMATSLRILESAVMLDGGVAAIRDHDTLVVYSFGGAATAGATLVETGWEFVAGSAAHIPSKYAGSFVVLESNRTSNRDRLLLVTPPPQ